MVGLQGPCPQKDGQKGQLDFTGLCESNGLAHQTSVVKGSSRHQCTVVIPSIPVCISGVTEGSQQLTVLEVEVSLTRNEWQKHPIVTGLEDPRILGKDCLRREYFNDPQRYQWAFGVAALERRNETAGD